MPGLLKHFVDAIIAQADATEDYVLDAFLSQADASQTDTAQYDAAQDDSLVDCALAADIDDEVEWGLSFYK